MLCLCLTFVLMILVAVAAVLIQRFFQNRDYKRQLEGEIPMRSSEKDLRRKQETVNLQLEAERARQDAVNAANMMSGH